MLINPVTVLCAMFLTNPFHEPSRLVGDVRELGRRQVRVFEINIAHITGTGLRQGRVFATRNMFGLRSLVKRFREFGCAAMTSLF